MVVATCLVIAVVAVTLFIVVNQPSPSMVAYKAQAQKIFNNAYGAWEQIRNYSLPRVDLVVVTKQWAIDTWGKGYAQQNVAAITIEQNIYQGLFLIPQNRSLYQADVDWAGNYVAATWEGKIYVVKENFDPWNLPSSEATFVHELTHIWQSNLPSPTTFDQDKAHTALIEGDASFMADTYTNLTKTGAISTDVTSTPGFPAYIITLSDLHPDTLSNLDYFPYTQGGIFINALHQNGGFATVNRAYTAGYVPSTTAQILNPEEYFENVTAKPVSLPAPSGGNWTQMQTSYGQNYNTYGEYFIEDLLGNWVTSSQAQIISAGWIGDNFTYYQNGSDNSTYLFVWNIEWSSSSVANAFLTAFQTIAKDNQAISEGGNQWFSNARHLSITLNATENSTFIACSTIQAATQPSYFT